MPWSECDSKCSYGTKVRSRRVIVTRSCKGKDCPALKVRAYDWHLVTVFFIECGKFQEDWQEKLPNVSLDLR